jgi:hypothetical protein
MRLAGRRVGGGAWGSCGLVLLLLAGCTTTRIVPVPEPGVAIDAAQTTASVAADNVELAVRASAWRGNPWDLDHYVAPFLVSLTNGTPSLLQYDYGSFRAFDDQRFQYTALPPAEVERIFRARAAVPERLAATGAPPILRRRPAVADPYWYPWDWSWYGGYGWPWYYSVPPALDDIYLRALPVGPLLPGARLEGFVYFPRLRADARGLRLEFHHQVGDQPRVLALSFVIDREKGRSSGS